VVEALTRRIQALPVEVRDGALAFAIAVFEVVSLAVAVNDADDGHAPAAAYVLLAATQIPLAFRRRAPVPVWLLVGAGTAAYGMTSWTDPPVFAGALLAIYSVATYARPRVAMGAAIATGILIVLSAVFDPQPHDLNDALVPLLGSATAWLAGFVMMSHRRNTVLLEERAARAEADRLAIADRMVADERMRIARELHDITAHHVAVIAVHAEAGASVLPNRPEDAERAFATIGDSARRALQDLRQTLGLLRADNGVESAPQPGIADIEMLVRELRDAGVDTTLDCSGDYSQIDDQVDLATFRIAQEAVTNILKHSGARNATLRVTKTSGLLELEVVDDGRGLPAAATPTTGNGFVGMQERVASCGGSLYVTTAPGGGGVRLLAQLPT
jgi:signal transduction histidine kinase